MTPLSSIASNAVRFPFSDACAMISPRRKPSCGALPPGVKIDELSMTIRMGWSGTGHIGVAWRAWPRTRKYYEGKRHSDVLRGSGLTLREIECTYVTGFLRPLHHAVISSCKR